MAALMPFIFPQFLDDNAQPIPGGSLTFYSAGTDTKKDTYLDMEMSILNTNPVILDSAGRCTVFLGSGLYDIVLKDADGETLRTVENVGIGGSVSGTFTVVNCLTDLLAIPSNSNTSINTGDVVYMLGYTSANDSGGGFFYYDSTSVATEDDGTILVPDDNGTGSGRWLRIYNGTLVDPRWWGATGNGTTNDTAAFTAANGISTATGLKVTQGTYLWSTDPSVTKQIVLEPGAILKWSAAITPTIDVVIPANDSSQHFDVPAAYCPVLSENTKVRPEWFGLVLTDMETNATANTTAMQKALLYYNVDISKATYYFDEQLVLLPGVQYDWKGSILDFSLFTTSKDSALVMSGDFTICRNLSVIANAQTGIEISGDNCILSDFKAYGNNTDAGATNAAAGVYNSGAYNQIKNGLFGAASETQLYSVYNEDTAGTLILENLHTPYIKAGGYAYKGSEAASMIVRSLYQLTVAGEVVAGDIYSNIGEFTTATANITTGNITTGNIGTLFFDVAATEGLKIKTYDAEVTMTDESSVVITSLGGAYNIVCVLGLQAVIKSDPMTSSDGGTNLCFGDDGNPFLFGMTANLLKNTKSNYTQFLSGGAGYNLNIFGGSAPATDVYVRGTNTLDYTAYAAKKITGIVRVRITYVEFTALASY